MKAGVRDAQQIVREIYDELKDDVPDLEERDVRDAISGYGISGKMSQEEIKVAIREAKRQMRLISAVEDAQEGMVPLRSGLQRDPVSDKVRDLQKKVRQAMREAGIDSSSIRSPEEQWRTALEGVKTRLRNQIHDLNEQLQTGKKTPKKIGIKYDQGSGGTEGRKGTVSKRFWWALRASQRCPRSRGLRLPYRPLRGLSRSMSAG